MFSFIRMAFWGLLHKLLRENEYTAANSSDSRNICWKVVFWPGNVLCPYMQVKWQTELEIY